MANPIYNARLEVGPGLLGRVRYNDVIVPSDTAAVAIGPGACYAASLYIGVAGNLTIISAGDARNNGLGIPVLYQNVPVGWFPVAARAVMATGTAADGIVGVSY